MKRFDFKWAAACCLAAGVAFAAPAWSATDIKLPIKVSSQTLRGKLMQQFADEVSKATDGRYSVTVYPGGQLYGGTAAAQAVQLGNVQMGTPPDSAFTGYTRLADLVETPFAFSSKEKYWDFMNGNSPEAIYKQLENAGFETLAMFGEGPMVIATKNRLLKRPDDFKGETIRTSGHKLVVDTVRSMGASTVKIDFPEVYSALQQGTISGVYTTFDAFISDKMYEVAPHVTLFPTHGAYFWVVNKNWWQQQPEKDRQIMRKIARKLAMQYNHQVWGDLNEYISTLKSHKADYFDPTTDPASLKAFKAAMQPTYAQLKKTYGDKIVDDLLAGKPITAADLNAK